MFVCVCTCMCLVTDSPELSSVARIHVAGPCKVQLSTEDDGNVHNVQFIVRL